MFLRNIPFKLLSIYSSLINNIFKQYIFLLLFLECSCFCRRFHLIINNGRIRLYYSRTSYPVCCYSLSVCFFFSSSTKNIFVFDFLMLYLNLIPLYRRYINYECLVKEHSQFFVSLISNYFFQKFYSNFSFKF